MPGILLFLIVALSSEAPSESKSSRIVLEARRNGLFQRFVHIDSTAPTEKMIRQLAASATDKSLGRVRRLVVTSDLDLLAEASHKYVLRDVAVDAILTRRMQASETGRFLMEIFCIADDCILRSRDFQGRHRELVLTGKNPLLIETGDSRVAILYAELFPSTGLVSLYGRFTRGSLEGAPLILSTISDRIQKVNLLVALRNDTMPFGSEQIPADFLLWDETPPEDLTSYRSTPYVLCSAWQVPQRHECMTWRYSKPSM